jgi:oxygen-independent coproporphyrinogen-3 oxidase
MPGLYLHIPFCVRKCIYCDFYSIPSVEGSVAQRLRSYVYADQHVFLDALEKELESLPENFAPETLFIGGGTPTELSDRDFESLLDLIRRKVNLEQVQEWTCESNPGTLTQAKAHMLRQAGVNRMSIGVQSFDPSALEFLGRIHNADEARDGIRMLQATGFDSINLDLIYGIPTVDPDIIETDIATAVALGVNHIAAYCLIFEDGTPLADLQRKGYVKEVDDDTELAQYQMVRQRLSEAGYRQYELSNYAQPGHESLHNLLYWEGREYFGCGPSAHSHWQGRRWSNVRSLETYCKQWLTGTYTPAMEETLPPEAKARELVIFGLRKIQGIDLADFEQRTGYSLEELYGNTLNWLCEIGMLARDETSIRLTEQGLFLSDSVFAELV